MKTMDSTTAASSCEELVRLVSLTSREINKFVRINREARLDATAVAQELTELEIVIGLLQDDISEGNSPILTESFLIEMVSLNTNCSNVVSEISTIVTTLETVGSSSTVALWDAGKKKHMTLLRQSLESLRRCFRLTMEAISHAPTELVNAMGAPAQHSKGAGEVLMGIHDLKSQLPDAPGSNANTSALLRHYLDNLTTYAASVHLDIGPADLDDDVISYAQSRATSHGRMVSNHAERNPPSETDFDLQTIIEDAVDTSIAPNILPDSGTHAITSTPGSSNDINPRADVESVTVGPRIAVRYDWYQRGGWNIGRNTAVCALSFFDDAVAFAYVRDNGRHAVEVRDRQTNVYPTVSNRISGWAKALTLSDEGPHKSGFTLWRAKDTGPFLRKWYAPHSQTSPRDGGSVDLWGPNGKTVYYTSKLYHNDEIYQYSHPPHHPYHWVATVSGSGSIDVFNTSKSHATTKSCATKASSRHGKDCLAMTVTSDNAIVTLWKVNEGETNQRIAVDIWRPDIKDDTWSRWRGRAALSTLSAYQLPCASRRFACSLSLGGSVLAYVSGPGRVDVINVCSGMLCSRFYTNCSDITCVQLGDWSLTIYIGGAQGEIEEWARTLSEVEIDDDSPS